MKRRAALSGVVASLAGTASARLPTPSPGARPAVITSLLQLLATPDAFNDVAVAVAGFAHLEFEGDALYLHREDFDRMLLANSVGLSLTREQARQWSSLSDQYVGVEGIFKARQPGTRAVRCGELTDITNFERLPSRAEVLAGLPKDPRP